MFDQQLQNDSARKDQETVSRDCSLHILKEMASTPEYRTFKHHYGDLIIGLDPDSVSSRAYARSLLTREQKTAAMHMMYTSDQRKRVILDAVDEKILEDRKAFHTFINILKQELAFSTLVKKLNGTYMKFEHESATNQTDYDNEATPQRNPNGTYTESKHTDQTGYGNGATLHDQRNPNGEDVQAPPDLKNNEFPPLPLVNVKERDRDSTDHLLGCVDALLMVVNENELRAVLGLMEPISGTLVEATRNSTTFTIGMYGQFLAAVVQTSPGGQGFDGAEQKTMRAIEVVKPSLVISVGVAYGKSKAEQKLCDVIVCTMVNDYTYKRLGVDDVRIRNSQPPVSPRLLNLFKNPMGWKKERAPNDFCAVKSGPLVSGPDLVDDPVEKEKRFKAFGDAKGGEMEGAAILSAIHAVQGDHKPEGIIIKAITDWGDGSKNKKWQPFAAHTAAHYVLHHLKKREAFNDLARKSPFSVETGV